MPATGRASARAFSGGADVTEFGTPNAAREPRLPVLIGWQQGLVERDAGPDGLRRRLGAARRRGRQVVATVVPAEGAAGAVPYWQLDWSAPTVLLLGNEGAGLGEELAAEADQRVTIPHSPDVESLNVAVAAAPLLLERWRRRLAA